MVSPAEFPPLALPVRPPYPPMEALAVGELPAGAGFSGRRFRHGATFLRWRPDKDPRLCTFAQVESGPDVGLGQFWSRQRAG